MNLNELRGMWSLPDPWRIRPITQGDNNLTQVIDTPVGKYVLRAYRRDRALEQIRYELHVLRGLREKDLPFHVPVPVPTATGELFAVLSGTIVTLSLWLSGSLPQEDQPEQTIAAGRALAKLGEALTGVQVEITSEVAPFPPSSDFEAWAGGPIDPAQILGELPITDDTRKRTLDLLEETQRSTPALYRALPTQIIHRDYDQSNILMEGNTVAGILDFEFCGRDLRVLDLAYALSKWPDNFWNTGKEWEILDSFARGYLQRQRLTPEELESLPRVLRLRATTSLFFRLGRYLRGLETQESMRERIQETLSDETWLQMNMEKLLGHIHSW